jgi:hypothetical protein
MEPLQGALGASRSTVVGAFTVSVLISGLLAPVVGRAIDRRGGRWLMTGASLLASAGLAALGQATSLLQLYLVWIVLGVAMAGTLYEPAFAVLTRAFVTHHRRAIAVLTLFGGFASTVFWPLGQALIGEFGWRSTAMIFCALNLVVCVPLHLFALPAAPEGAATETTPGEVSTGSLRAALRDAAFTGSPRPSPSTRSCSPVPQSTCCRCWAQRHDGHTGGRARRADGPMRARRLAEIFAGRAWRQRRWRPSRWRCCQSRCSSSRLRARQSAASCSSLCFTVLATA